LKAAVLAGLAIFIANAAPAEEMKAPQISVVKVDWDAAAASLGGQPATEAFAPLNKATEGAFPGIGKSPVPVLLPFDVDGFAKDRAANPDQPADKTAETVDRFVRSNFHATKFFMTGPAGYDSTFSLTPTDVP